MRASTLVSVAGLAVLFCAGCDRESPTASRSPIPLPVIASGTWAGDTTVVQWIHGGAGCEGLESGTPPGAARQATLRIDRSASIVVVELTSPGPFSGNLFRGMLSPWAIEATLDPSASTYSRSCHTYSLNPGYATAHPVAGDLHLEGDGTGGLRGSLDLTFQIVSNDGTPLDSVRGTMNIRLRPPP